MSSKEAIALTLAAKAYGKGWLRLDEQTRGMVAKAIVRRAEGTGLSLRGACKEVAAMFAWQPGILEA